MQNTPPAVYPFHVVHDSDMGANQGLGWDRAV
jgi:hypothetical protein